MTRYIGPESQIAHRFGEPIFDAGKVLAKRNFPPGQHGDNRRHKVSEYGVQLAEKQRIKYTYGVLERQFRNLFDRAVKAEGITGEVLLQNLESRLDNIVFRLGIAPARAATHQLASHKHVVVNDNVVNTTSYQVKTSDVVGVHGKAKSLEVIEATLAGFNHSRYPWLEWSGDAECDEFLRCPDHTDTPENTKEQLIVELCSKQ